MRNIFLNKGVNFLQSSIQNYGFQDTVRNIFLKKGVNFPPQFGTKLRFSGHCVRNIFLNKGVNFLQSSIQTYVFRTLCEEYFPQYMQTSGYLTIFTLLHTFDRSYHVSGNFLRDNSCTYRIVRILYYVYSLLKVNIFKILSPVIIH